jgi:hypothetical protein
MLFTFAYLHLMLNIVAVIFAFRFPAIPANAKKVRRR